MYPVLCLFLMSGAHTVAQARLDTHYVAQAGIELVCLSLTETTGLSPPRPLASRIIPGERVCTSSSPGACARSVFQPSQTCKCSRFLSLSPRSCDPGPAHAHMRSPCPLPGRASLHAASLGTACARDLQAHGLAPARPAECACACPELRPAQGGALPSLRGPVTQHLWRLGSSEPLADP